MTHSLTLTEDTCADVYSKLVNPPNTPYESRTCPRWLNKELKFVLSTLHSDLMHNVLGLLQRNLRESKEKRSLWARAFIGLLTLSMVTESMQVSVRCKEETDKKWGTIPKNDTTAESEITYMDQRLESLLGIFRMKYGATDYKDGKSKKTEFTPITNLKDRDSLDEPAQRLAKAVNGIVRDYRKWYVCQARVRLM